MAIDYYKVLNALNVDVTVIGKSKEGVEKFKSATTHDAIEGGLSSFVESNSLDSFTHAIVAVGLEELFNTTKILINHKLKNILLEKPGGLNFVEIESLKEFNNNQSNILIAYNRRFYQSVLKAKEIIENDGGVKSFHFEFTEWAHVIEKIEKKPGIKENWFLANSTHVVDTAFYLGGIPKTMHSFSSGNLSWHPKSVFVGSGITEDGALFTYHSNWEAPGRWFAEFLTNNHRLIFKPMEELAIQEKGSVQVNKVEIESDLDKVYKPGLYLQTQNFLNGKTEDFLTLDNHVNKLGLLKQILGV